MLKETKGKLEYRLIPPETLKAVAEVLAFGNRKYEPFSWMLVDSSHYVDATYRHLEAARLGEVLDKESKLLHIAHAITNLVFLLDRQLKQSDSVMGFHSEAENILHKLAELESEKEDKRRREEEALSNV